MTIDAYLRQLRALLPATRRERFLTEAEAHLRDAAAAFEADGLERGAAETRATAEFGEPVAIAARVARETAPVAVRRAGGVALVALAALLVPLYGIPENQLPPAPWASRPGHLTGLLALTFGLRLASLAAVVLGLMVSTRWDVRHAGRLVVLGPSLGCAAALTGFATMVAWRLEAPETPLGSLLVLTLVATSVPLAAALGAAAWARERVRA